MFLKESLKQYFTEIKEDVGAIASIYTSKCKEKSLKQKASTDISFLDHLPYRTYHPEYGIFENHNTLGFALKISHLFRVRHDTKSSLENLVSTDLPPGAIIQVINFASPKIGDTIDKWFFSGEEKGLLGKVAEKRRSFFSSGVWKSILGHRQNFIVRDFNLYLTVSIQKPKISKKLLTSLYELEALKVRVAEVLARVGCNVEYLNDLELAAFIKEIINPSLSIYKNKISERIQDIRKYFESDHKIEMHSDGIVFSNKSERFKYIVFEVTEWPDTWRLENGVDYVGKFESGDNLPCPFYISYGFSLRSRDESVRLSNQSRVIKTKQAESQLPMFFPKMIEETEDYIYACERIDRNNERMGKAVMHIIACIEDQKNELQYAQIIQDHFTRLRFKVERVKHDTANTLIQTVPFGLAENWQLLNQLKVLSTKLSISCMNLMPVFSDTKSIEQPLMLFTGRRGQITFFDNYLTLGTDSSYNIVIVGPPGAGKSVWLQEYAKSILRTGGQTVILDDGRSFENTCKLLGGEFVNFGGGDFCINPFSLFRDKDKDESDQDYRDLFEAPFIELITSILCVIINIDKNNSKDPEVELYRSILRNAVSGVMGKKGNKGGFKDIHEELINNLDIAGEEIRAIIKKIEYVLRPYSHGRLASYFNGEATLTQKNRLTVFEFSDLEHNEILQNSVLMTVIFLVYSKMKGRETRTSLIIDEAWRLLKHSAIKGFIEGISRKARKYKGSLVVASQSIGDFHESKSEAAAAVLATSEWRVLFAVDGKDREMLTGQLGMDEAQIEIAKGLSGLRGAYSEFMLRNRDGAWQISRLLLDKFSAKLYSSKADEVVAIRKLKQQGLSIEDAIEKLIEGESR